MNLKALVFLTALGSLLSLGAAEAPAPTPAPTPSVTNRTVKVHSGCKPKRTGKRGGGVEIKHNIRCKKAQDAEKK